MLSVTIEPGFFAPPFGARTRETVQNYVDSLLAWKGVLDSGHVFVHVSERTSEALLLSNSYPLRPWLRALLAEARVVEYDANTIAIVAETVLARSASLEEAIRVTDLLAEDLRMTPSLVYEDAPEEIRAATERVVLMLAIVRAFGTDAIALTNGIVIRETRNVPEVNIRAVITILEHTRTDLGEMGDLPKAFEGRSIICPSFHDYLMALDECTLWRLAKSDAEMEIAIKTSHYKGRALRGELTAWEALPTFRLNAKFLRSVKACRAQEDAALGRSSLRAISETIDGLQMAATHILRTGEGPNDPPITRGVDHAWRRDVDHEYHLHYWLCGDGQLELSCIVRHNTFEINR
jgi:hypothetical protein